MTDRELRIEKRWLLAAKIDPEKFLLFYEKYRPRIYRFVLLKTQNEDVAEDLTAEIFLLAQKGLWKFRWQGVTFGGWLYRIAVNLVRHQHRSQVRQGLVDLESVPEIRADTTHPLSGLIDDENRRAVQEAVLDLEETTATIFLLHYWQERTTEEIALIVEMPVGTVRTRLRRGRDELHRILRKRLGHEADGKHGREVT
ncbi:MAG: RNA polymerase sigma factor [bacterium]|nr:RNA polymerase sigma factor [bacterium]